MEAIEEISLVSESSKPKMPRRRRRRVVNAQPTRRSARLQAKKRLSGVCTQLNIGRVPMSGRPNSPVRPKSPVSPGSPKHQRGGGGGGGGCSPTSFDELSPYNLPLPKSPVHRPQTPPPLPEINYTPEPTPSPSPPPPPLPVRDYLIPRLPHWITDSQETHVEFKPRPKTPPSSPERGCCGCFHRRYD